MDVQEPGSAKAAAEKCTIFEAFWLIRRPADGSANQTYVAYRLALAAGASSPEAISGQNPHAADEPAGQINSANGILRQPVD